MVKTTLPTAASLLMLATTVFGACNTISYTSCADKTVHWYDPTNGEVCDPLDCGGGRAPVKYDVPCCAAYTGTEPCVSTTSTLSCWAPSSVSASSTIASTSSTETTSVTASADTSVTSSTGVAAKTSSLDNSQSTTVASTPSTTAAPTQSTGSDTTESGTATSSSSAQPVSTNIAGSSVGPLMAVAGAAIGAIILI
ncbi:uncharacterized protein N7529_005342 [Penicillium soppii]|jgi:hypothetical protein|uniref:uncharacterized protein n=1 Tax=Penicillium soppii TaxID=69789 RepID=UPI002547F008|nr:uncharacterized protein N7529_005342 [Penicillium soppii]KAJ5872989.1 hypothetical protein N7529_005342 [Penicillium soppii]